jgi:hypothetical protein
VRARASLPGVDEIRRVVEHMTLLAGDVERNSTDKVLALWTDDFDAICKDLKTAMLFGIRVDRSGLLRWRGFLLVRTDTRSHVVAPQG